MAKTSLVGAKVNKALQKEQVSMFKDKKIVVALDLDNTVVDFTGGFRDHLASVEGLTRFEALKKYPDPDTYDFVSGTTPWFESREEFFEKFLKAEEAGLYLNLRAKSGAIKVIKEFMKDDRVELRILTARNPKYNEHTMINLKRKGLSFEIENLEYKEHYPAHVFIDDKDSFVKKIRTGKFVTADRIVKEVIVPENAYNLDLDPIKTWDGIARKLDETVDRMLTM